MRVIICEPGKPAKALPTKNEPLSVMALRRFLGGSWCEMLPEGFPKQVVMLVDESGAFSQKPQNGSVMICGSRTPVFGTYIICRAGKDGKHYPLEEEAAERLLAGLRPALKASSTASGFPSSPAGKAACCLCGQPYEGFGNNAAPLSNGECCDKCNAALVIPERMKQIKGFQKQINDAPVTKIKPIPKTIPTQLEAIAAVMCDDYCKFVDNCDSEEALAKICKSCPIGLLEMEGRS